MNQKEKFKPGDLVRYIVLSRTNNQSGKLGFIVKMTQRRWPHRSDVYFVKFQNEVPREVDERWLEAAPDIT